MKPISKTLKILNTSLFFGQSWTHFTLAVGRKMNVNLSILKWCEIITILDRIFNTNSKVSVLFFFFNKN